MQVVEVVVAQILIRDGRRYGALLFTTRVPAAALAFAATSSHTCVCMPVAVYLRVSTEEQRERQSIAAQRECAERYCALH